jgi:hypothetical protein
VEIIGFIVGLAIVSAVLFSAVKTVVLPRNAQSLITRSVFRLVYGLLSQVARFPNSFAGRDRILALVAPFGLLLLPVVWVTLVTLGFTLIYWSTGSDSLEAAFHLSGSSITTLGFAPADTLTHRIFAFTEATIGLILVALLITFLPSLYSAFSSRETLVTKLEVRAGEPPSAAEFLLRHYRIGWLDQLEPFWLAWEQWFAEIEETHTTFPMLALFRSPNPRRSWITAAGTVLDSAALTLTVLKDMGTGAAAVSIRAGFIALRNIADNFGIDYNSNPEQGDPISISRAEFDQMCRELRDQGLPVVDDLDEAWLHFAGWRVNYDTVLLTLAQITSAPVAPWVSDRSATSHREPRITRMGQSDSS